MTTPKAESGKKRNRKEQNTIEGTMSQVEAQDVEMRDKDEEKTEISMDKDKDKETNNGEEEPASHLKKEEGVAEETAANSEGDHKEKDQTDAYDVAGEASAKVVRDSEPNKVANKGCVVEWSSRDEEPSPSSILRVALRHHSDDPKTIYCQPPRYQSTSDIMCSLMW